ncbi:MAG: bifunctional 2-polyprenyl-6-hydroxyphenol methylase/3-demethylubiquinol 3-O-methyltransferase UbiG [Hyphomicrobiales bacterium]
MISENHAVLDPAEVEKFSALAAQWWDPAGKFAVLHKFNPVRLTYIREQVTARFRRDPFEARPLEGLSLLDVGCGGGLLCEPMARLGAAVTGIDPSDRNIATAKVHAEEMGLAIDYRVATAEDLLAGGAAFDVVLAMEVIEHVPSPVNFVATCAGLLKPDGLLFLATLNRTLKSFGLAIIGAEYVLGWLPKGTHQWEKFITPEELEVWLLGNGLAIQDRTGVVYNPLAGAWRQARDMAVNYMMVAQKPSAAGN